MTCRYCAATIADGRDICHFHAKTLRLMQQGRCIWCQRSRHETDFPIRASSYCTQCLASRIIQRGERRRLNRWLSKVRAA